MANKTFKVVIDAGNSMIKYFFNGEEEPRLILGQYVKLPKNADFDSILGDVSSPFIKVGDTAYHWGQFAQFSGIPEPVVYGVKTDLLRYSILATLGKYNDKLTEYSCNILVSVPAISRFNEMYPGFAGNMQGEYRYIHNGDEMTVNIESVRVLPEATGTIITATKLNRFNNDGLALVIDLGLGTAIYTLYHPATRKVVSSFCQEVGGVIGLAKRLSVADKVANRIGTSLPAAMMAQAIREDFSYNGLNFFEEAKPIVEQWTASIRKEASFLFGNYKNDIKSKVISGGGAHIWSKVEDPKWALPNPELANLNGLKELK